MNVILNSKIVKSSYGYETLKLKQDLKIEILMNFVMFFQIKSLKNTIFVTIF